MQTFLSDGPDDSAVRFLFAHGAGGAMDTPFMGTMARLLAERGIRVERFEFLYMAARRTGKRGGPDRQPVLIESWKEAVLSQRVAGRRLFIGGKSLGGRIATMVADEMGVDGVVCFGYPFHPPGKPEKLRTDHLRDLRTPALILQGERDPFGTRSEVATYDLSPTIRVEWLIDGDHSLRPRAASGATEKGNVERAAALAADFMLAP
ncbi:MAG TPA: alpha/beta family hydrolase [Thermoanaerobaculia bacterium]|nr:alpha/beta family hydrolase [Thermoanaerobaculia bacterium]